MECRRLGNSELDVPVVGMGTWRTFDVVAPADQAKRRVVVDVALESGANLFDSSPMYGAAERVLGAALAGRRERALVATKVWTPDDREAEAQIARALGYFGGRIDVYQVHNLVAWPKRLARLERLRDEGQVRAVGITHYSHAAFPDLMTIMRSGRVASIQIPYNAPDRAAERDVLPLAADLGIGVIVMRPLAEGSLAASPPPADRLQPLASFGVRTWAQALLKWVLSDPRISTAIPATSNPTHARENAEAGAPPWLGPDERAYVANLAQQFSTR
jgi:aryl-alcohol dehydrogenase-like predicted oxidoreductase